MASAVSAELPNVRDFFMNIEKDASRVSWGHAINNKELLVDSIEDPNIMMLEADVSEGTLSSEGSNSKKIPIMAHPPHITSDLSLENWILSVIKANKEGNKKGAKLDFKDLTIVSSSLEILARYRSSIDFPLWLNADILEGPGSARKPVDADIFLSLCREFFPMATLSLGWTTGFDATQDDQSYTTEMIEEMVHVIEKNNVDQPITFPIRAAFVGTSNESLSQLIEMVPGSSITIWSSAEDEVDLEDLLALQESSKEIYIDLPEVQKKEYDELIEASHSGEGPSSSILPSQTAFWATASTVTAALTALYMTGE